ncbi:hypothetical protein [Abyssibius alkaniclasticus]|uniref:hypothetical protein n=1 Tax=Abyssibius alkaniclasticus TaxID=2881234 RepID=UPI0040584347
MSQTLRDFINAREAEVKTSIKALNDELRELRAAKSAIDGGATSPAPRSSSGRVTHRDMIVSVLNDHPEGGTSDRVIEWISEKYETEIPQASMSSQLSRAKSDGLLELDTATKVWKSAKQSSKKNEPPEGGSQITEDVKASSYQEGQRTMPGLPSATQGAAPTPFGNREGGQQDV